MKRQTYLTLPPQPHPRYAKLAAKVGLPTDSFTALDVLAEMDSALDREFLRAVGIALDEQP